MWQNSGTVKTRLAPKMERNSLGLFGVYRSKMVQVLIISSFPKGFTMVHRHSQAPYRVGVTGLTCTAMLLTLPVKYIEVFRLFVPQKWLLLKTKMRREMRRRCFLAWNLTPSTALQLASKAWQPQCVEVPASKGVFCSELAGVLLRLLNWTRRVHPSGQSFPITQVIVRWPIGHHEFSGQVQTCSGTLHLKLRFND